VIKLRSNSRRINHRTLLLGRGVAEVGFAPSRLNYGTVARNQFHQQTLTLTNLTDETQALTVDGGALPSQYFTVRVPPAGRTAPGKFPLSLAPGATQDLVFEFGSTGKCRHRSRVRLLGSQFFGGSQTIPLSVRAN
jgi:hypothetical protein